MKTERVIISVFAIVLMNLSLIGSATWALGAKSIIEIIQDALPCVVAIESENYQLSVGPNALVGDEASRSVMVMRPVGVARFANQGAGIILDPSGIIVANAHTVKQPSRIKVILHDKREFDAKILSIAPEEDLVFLRIFPPEKLSNFMRLAGEETIRPGDQVYNIGNSEMLKGAISEGRITGLGFKNSDTGVKESRYLALLKINFNIYQGDSGGPVIAKDGNLAGLLAAGSANGDRVSLAISSTLIRQYFNKCMEKK